MRRWGECVNEVATRMPRRARACETRAVPVSVFIVLAKMRIQSFRIPRNYMPLELFMPVPSGERLLGLCLPLVPKKQEANSQAGLLLPIYTSMSQIPAGKKREASPKLVQMKVPVEKQVETSFLESES